MDLAKAHLDLGLYTNNKDEMLDFWQTEIGLAYDHLGKLGGGVHQHRHFLGEGPTGPILKINHARDPLPPSARSGLRTLLIARENISNPVSHTDPDGNDICLVPPGYFNITATGLILTVRDLAQFKDFYGRILDLPDAGISGEVAFKCAETVLIAREDKTQPLAEHHVAQGYRYMTAQIFKADAEHAHVMAEGGSEGMAPKTLGTTVRYSFIRDFDGNWIELSQRATLTGSLD
ncbi:MAG: VOC family protein [Sneathiella sp.]